MMDVVFGGVQIYPLFHGRGHWERMGRLYVEVE